MRVCSLLTAATICLMAAPLHAQPKGFNYDEDKVPTFVLPDPLVTEDGKKVTDAATWKSVRRPELMALFEEHVYGKQLPPLPGIRFQPGKTHDNALGGKAVRKEIVVRFSATQDEPSMTILLYAPKGKKSPAFLGLNFNGNHAVTTDPEVTLNPNWMRNNDKGVVDNKATEATRGSEATRWPIEQIIDRGYAVATAYYGDIDPDFDDGFHNGVHPLFATAEQKDRTGNAAGSIGAWAWGLSRALDYLETDPLVDAKKVAVIGHSRLGKTSLWAGACDERFALVISNNSGCGGAALSRRAFGETVARINTSFPHWFCKNYRKYNDNEGACPVDQHELVALVAPRPVYIASAAEDLWADPRGEFLAGVEADPVYKLLGTDGFAGLRSNETPAIDQPILTGTIGYHRRAGSHDVKLYDWEQFMTFADRRFRQPSSSPTP